MSGKNRESESPILFSGISESYSHSVQILWNAEFQGKHPFYWDKSLLFHPISHLLGIALETALKGLLACRGHKIPRTHNLEKLCKKLNDAELEAKLDSSLQNLEVPSELLDLNSDKPEEEVNDMYRRYHFHLHCLNKIYDRPYVTRYPVLGGHSLPDPIAIQKMTSILQDQLNTEKLTWKP